MWKNYISAFYIDGSVQKKNLVITSKFQNLNFNNNVICIDKRMCSRKI